jgi:hypothetical protein
VLTKAAPEMFSTNMKLPSWGIDPATMVRRHNAVAVAICATVRVFPAGHSCSMLLITLGPGDRDKIYPRPDEKRQ